MSWGGVTVTADRSIQNSEGVSFSGNVQLHRGLFNAIVDTLDMTKKRDIAVLRGVHHANDGSKIIKAHEIQFNLKSGQWKAIGQVQSIFDL
jgi:lipopolysaccharide export system protein LptA